MLPVVGMLDLLLTGRGEDIAFDLHLYTLLVEAGQFDSDGVGFAVFLHLDLGHMLEVRKARGSLDGARSGQLNRQFRIMRVKNWSKSPGKDIAARGVVRGFVSVMAFLRSGSWLI
jgi:hypothetical protein